MKRVTFRSIKLAGLTAALLGLGALAGCVVVEEDPYGPAPIYLADLQVDWRILGSQSADYCDAFGIQSWIVEVRGPESRDVVVDCRAHYWSSENDLLSMFEGHYDITVRAVDRYGYTVALQGSRLDLLADGYLRQLSFEFRSHDFGF